MNHPLRENLEFFIEGERSWIRCTRCNHVLCPAAEDWKKACKRALQPPTKAGPLMNVLVNHFLLEQLFCPCCGTLLNTALIETIRS
jgi:hypothetical protein